MQGKTMTPVQKIQKESWRKEMGKISNKKGGPENERPKEREKQHNAISPSAPPLVTTGFLCVEQAVLELSLSLSRPGWP